MNQLLNMMLYILQSSCIQCSQVINQIVTLKFSPKTSYLATNPRPKKRDNIPENYWDLLEKCWDIDSHKRPSFEKIVEILKDDKFALNEFSMITNIDELHEYQIRIDSD